MYDTGDKVVGRGDYEIRKQEENKVGTVGKYSGADTEILCVRVYEGDLYYK